MSDEGRQRIADWAGEDGWWKSDGFSTYVELAEGLMHLMSEEAALSILERAHFTTAAEYGD